MDELGGARSDAGGGAGAAELLELAAMAARLGRQDLHEALRSVTDAGVRLTGAQYGAFFHSGEDELGDRLDVFMLSGEPSTAFPDEVPVRHTALFAQTFSGRGAVRVADVLTDPRYGGNASGGVPDGHVPVRSYLAVPVVTPEGRVIGALLFGHREPGRFDERSEVAALAVASHAATAAENARLLGSAHRALEEAEASARRLELLQRITALLSTAVSTAQITRRVPAALTRALGCTRAHVLLLDPLPDGARTPALVEAAARSFAAAPAAVRDPATRAAATGVPVLEGPVLAVPLTDRLRRPLGVLSTTWAGAAGAAGAGGDVSDLLLAVAGQVAQALERTRLFDAERRARDELAASVTALTDLSRTLQRSLLPRRLPRLERVQVAVRYQPAVSGAEVGGDWYDVIEAEDGLATFVIGDVQGHSTTAAALMGQLRTAVRAYVTEGHDPATALARTSAVLLAMDAELFATCCLAQLDQVTGELHLATAGHPVPLALVADGRVAEVQVPAGPPLGIVEGAAYSTRRLRLDERTRLLLYTDGVVESPAHPLEEGVAAVREAALAHRDGTCDELADSMMAGIPHRLADDAALLVLDYAGPRARREELVTALPPHLGAVGDARRFLRRALADWGVDGRTRDDAELITSELVTNAVTHTGDPAQLSLVREPDAGWLRICVVDGSTRHPRRREAGPEALGGRGLAIVDVLAESWGVAPQGEGKAVWAQLTLS
ncbi:SpoIIE family protein phosphatase [Quadrisphaera sp. DSM 44207]|uniref:SpoIIE family protein phosphatase n=1 Tax=Quadrisphaera sp. DSM 44207 TaxID=1881057 RepID=UPI000880EB28|nr:SpoIIE family protein phosphatase [Quadrisphaera sp. DSM 44207]SDQ15740.1 Serine phosphatase RsbU, regulator of sigma subunit [Quadrisphaera sp. DSM 44207]